MSKQTVQYLLIVAVVASVIFACMFWINRSYERMKYRCEHIIGGSFYSISLTQNICVTGTEVQQLD